MSFVVFPAAHSNIQIKCFSKGMINAASSPCYKKKKKCHRATDWQQTLTTRALPNIYSILETCCHATQTFPVLHVMQPSMCFRENERDESGRRAFYSVERRVLCERKHMLLFSLFFFFFSKRVVHTGDWLLTCYIHNDDWIPNNGRLK